MKLNITAIYPPKDVQTKYGLKQKASIKAQEHGDNYLSYWVSTTTRDWKVGDEVDVQSVDSREYNGKTYYDISMPKTSGGIPPEVAKTLETILKTVTNIRMDVSRLVDKLPREKDTRVSEVDQNLNPDDVPF